MKHVRELVGATVITATIVAAAHAQPGTPPAAPSAPSCEAQLATATDQLLDAQANNGDLFAVKARLEKALRVAQQRVAELSAKLEAATKEAKK